MLVDAHKRLPSNFGDDMAWIDIDGKKRSKIGLKLQINACVEVDSVNRSSSFMLECSQKLTDDV